MASDRRLFRVLRLDDCAHGRFPGGGQRVGKSSFQRHDHDQHDGPRQLGVVHR